MRPHSYYDENKCSYAVGCMMTNAFHSHPCGAAAFF